MAPRCFVAGILHQNVEAAVTEGDKVSKASHLKKLRNLIFVGSFLLILAVNILPTIFGEGPYLTRLFIGGWAILLVFSLTYFYGFLKWKDK